MIDLRQPYERDAAAGEYVLGTLSVEDHAQFVAALALDPALLAQVYVWQDRLLPLSAGVAPMAPRPQLWPRIDGAVHGTATLHAALARPRERTPWWQRLSVWQGLSGLAVAASLVLAVLLVQRLAEPPVGVRHLAVLQSPDNNTTGWVVELQGRTLRLVPVADTGVVPAGRSLQFWTKPPGADGPTSLGLVHPGQTVELPLSRLPGVGQKVLFEITLEPEGGSTIGRPTGPILYVGRTMAL